jgi:hypothetical protein
MVPREIDEIITELKKHPDYVHMELFTKRDFRTEVVNFFETEEDETKFNDLVIERCVTERIDEYKKVLVDFFCYSYEEYCSINEGVENTLTEWFEKNKNKLNETSVD